MANEDIKQKLTAILSADVKDYSRLLSQDRVGTINTLKSHRDLFADSIQQYGGRVIDTPGDNILAAFESVSDTVNCAVEIQRELAERNAEVPSARMMQWRIGISLGDVVEEEGRIYGDGVNIAARVEALAEPGGICISGTVYDQVKNKLGLEYEDLGEQEVKNIPEPVRIYKVLSYPGAAAHGVMKAKSDATRRWRNVSLVVAIIIIIVIGSVVTLNNITQKVLPDREDTQQTSVDAEDFTVPGFGGAPAIAVLPFDNLSEDPDQEYFADGIAEDLITRLSAWRSFPVIARNSSFTYKGQAVDVKQVSRELGARYLVEGSVRKAGDQVRISAQLIDATTGAHVWADRYDRHLKDIFNIQDEITMAIATAMGVSIDMAEGQRLARSEPQNLTAYELWMRGKWIRRSFVGEQTVADREARLNQARNLFKKAIETDPAFAPAYADLAYSTVLEWWGPNAATEIAQESLIKAQQLSQKSIMLDPELPEAYLALAEVHGIRGQRSDMFSALYRSIELDPCFSRAYRSLGHKLVNAGQPEKAIELLDLGIRLSPRDPMLYDFFRAKSRAYFSMRQYEKAIEWIKLGMQQGGNIYIYFLDLAASQSHAGQHKEAKISLQKARDIAPYELTVHRLQKVFNYQDDERLKRFLDGLRMAGLPE